MIGIGCPGGNLSSCKFTKKKAKPELRLGISFGMSLQDKVIADRPVFNHVADGFGKHIGYGYDFDFIALLF